jgi:anti-sigma B factor antagonist
VDHGDARAVLSGEIDNVVAEDVRRQILAVARAGVSTVVVDLRAVTFCDSSGLHAIVDAGMTLVARGVDVKLSEAQPHVERILDLTGVRERFGREQD